MELRCEFCGSVNLEPGDDDTDGFLYCSDCQARTRKPEAAFDEEDINGEGGVYGSYFRSQPKSADTRPDPVTPGKILPILSPGGGTGKEDAASVALKLRARGFLCADEPQDFGGNGARGVVDPEALAHGIRMQYVRGLQVMLQLQCEALVERCGVSPLVCGFAGSVWLRYIAASRVFDNDWAKNAVSSSEGAISNLGRPKDEHISFKPLKANHNSRPRNLHGQRLDQIWFRSLRKTIPVYSTLATCYLVCHLAREAVLPTDIYEWAMEGKVPYIAAFKDVDKILQDTPNFCPFSSKLLFKPVRIIGAWQLEAVTGSIAETIGLHLPSVNFYAIASRFLKDLLLPVEKILPHACRLFEWSVPADLWISSNIHRLPTRICVMSILVVAIRILYDLNGKGKWEMCICNSDVSSLNKQSTISSPDTLNLNSVQNSIRGSDFGKASDSDIEGLFQALKDAYNINILPDYSKDLGSYLEHCRDAIFSGLKPSSDEEIVIERLWDTYNKLEDNKPEAFHMEGKRSNHDASSPIICSSSAKKPREEDGPSEGTSSQDKCMGEKRELEKMKISMEENNFHYLSPRRKHKSDGYLHYRRQKVDGKLIYVAHADYYVLLRACAKLVGVDVRTMHLGVLKFERRLVWIEERIRSSLDSLQIN